MTKHAASAARKHRETFRAKARPLLEELGRIKGNADLKPGARRREQRRVEEAIRETFAAEHLKALQLAEDAVAGLARYSPRAKERRALMSAPGLFADYARAFEHLHDAELVELAKSIVDGEPNFRVKFAALRAALAARPEMDLEQSGAIGQALGRGDEDFERAVAEAVVARSEVAGLVFDGASMLEDAGLSREALNAAHAAGDLELDGARVSQGEKALSRAYDLVHLPRALEPLEAEPTEAAA